jgi:hypothetical protein
MFEEVMRVAAKKRKVDDPTNTRCACRSWLLKFHDAHYLCDCLRVHDLVDDVLPVQSVSCLVMDFLRAPARFASTPFFSRFWIRSAQRSFVVTHVNGALDYYASGGKWHTSDVSEVGEEEMLREYYLIEE